MAISTVAVAFKFISLLILDIVAFIGNSLILLSGLSSSDLRKLNNAFIFNMAIADLCQSILIMPFGLASVYYQRWPLSNGLCNAVAFLKVVVTLVSVQSLAGISLDRYFYIVKSKQAMNTKLRSAFCIAVVWFNGSILAISPFFGWGELGFDDGKIICTILFYKTLSHTLTVFCIGLFVPVGIMVFSYYKIFKLMHANGMKVRHAKFSKRISNKMGSQVDAAAPNNVTLAVEGLSSEVPSCSDRRFISAEISCSNLELQNAEYTSIGHDTFSTRITSKESNHERNLSGGELNAKEQKVDAVIQESRQCVLSPTIVNNEENEDQASKNNYVEGVSARAKGFIPEKNQQVKKFTKVEEKKSKHQLKTLLSHPVGNMTQKEFKLFKTIMLVVAVFLACWLPYVVFNVLRVTSLVEDNNTMDTINMWMGFANSSFNPLIYGLTNRQFRNEIKKLFHKLKCDR